MHHLFKQYRHYGYHWEINQSTWSKGYYLLRKLECLAELNKEEVYSVPKRDLFLIRGWIPKLEKWRMEWIRGADLPEGIEYLIDTVSMHDRVLLAPPVQDDEQL